VGTGFGEKGTLKIIKEHFLDHIKRTMLLG
jgi:hypothetical protein